MERVRSNMDEEPWGPDQPSSSPAKTSLCRLAADSITEYVYDRARLLASEVKVACHAAALPGTWGTSARRMLFSFST